MDHEKKALYVAKRTSDLDLDDVAESWSAVRNDANATAWVSLTVNAAKKVEIAATGAAGLDSLCSSFAETDIYFGGVRVVLGATGAVKFYHFFVVGSEVGGMKKGKASLWKNSIHGAMDGAHGSIEISSEVSREERVAEMRRQIAALCGGGGVAWSVGA